MQSYQMHVTVIIFRCPVTVHTFRFPDTVASMFRSQRRGLYFVANLQWPVFRCPVTVAIFRPLIQWPYFVSP